MTKPGKTHATGYGRPQADREETAAEGADLLKGPLTAFSSGLSYLGPAGAPQGWRMVSKRAVEHPQGGVGALLQNQRTGIYCLYIFAPRHSRSIDQRYAFNHADLGARIKTLRISAGLTQAQLADRAGMTKTGVASWEQGATRPSSASLAILQDVIGLTPEDMPEE